MLTRIEALGFRCLRHVNQALGPFQVLVGPNSSGKSTLLDVVSFVRQVLADGPEAAVEQRVSRFEELVWGRAGEHFELAVEARIPEALRSSVEVTRYQTARFELRLEWDAEAGRAGIAEERLMLRNPAPAPAQQALELGDVPAVPETVFAPRQRGLTRTVVRKKRDTHDNYYSEITPEPGQGWFAAARLGPWRSALANLPDDARAFPVASWLRTLLAEQVSELNLRELAARGPCPPLRGRRLRPDGSNLPWVVADLAARFPERANGWVERVRAALPDLEAVRTAERQDDRHAYLVVRYQGGLEQPSWASSPGTLRVLALTLLEHLPGPPGIHLVELPESALYPHAARVVFESLRSVGSGQVLATTHSPELLALAAPAEVLRFARDPSRGTLVTGGDPPCAPPCESAEA
jgi:predicted ATPase